MPNGLSILEMEKLLEKINPGRGRKLGNKMKLIKHVKNGFKNLLVNKMRTGLAILGIVIGIGSVIALISMGEASKQSVQSRIQSMGSNLLTIMPGSQSVGMVRGSTTVQSLTYDDAKAIMTDLSITTVKHVSPEYSTRSQVIAGATNTNTTIVGVTPQYKEVRNVSVISGSFINEEQITSLAKVAVLGPTVADDLFQGSNPVGMSIRINGQIFQVIGVTKAKGSSGMNNQDDMVYIPLTTAQQQLFGVKYLSTIVVQTKDDDMMNRAMNQVGYLLIKRHKISEPSDADFRIMNQEDMLETATEVAGTFTSMLTGVAAISLIVGGIGIMNIMLMSVTERTKEIGLRKALGAKKKDIVFQFLIESIILTFVGGLIGIVIGIVGFGIYTKINNSSFTVSINSVLLAFVVSAAIGVLFGWYPARRAANMQPIEALRYE